MNKTTKYVGASIVTIIGVIALFFISLYGMQPYLEIGALIAGKIHIVPGQSLILDSPFRPGIVRIAGAAIFLWAVVSLIRQYNAKKLGIWNGALFCVISIFGFRLAAMAVPLLENIGNTIGLLGWATIQLIEVSSILYCLFAGSNPGLVSQQSGQALLVFYASGAYVAEVFINLYRFPPYADGNLDVIWRHFRLNAWDENLFSLGNVIWGVFSIVGFEMFFCFLLSSLCVVLIPNDLTGHPFSTIGNAHHGGSGSTRGHQSSGSAPNARHGGSGSTNSTKGY
jgi:hypothetical protein